MKLHTLATGKLCISVLAVSLVGCAATTAVKAPVTKIEPAVEPSPTPPPASDDQEMPLQRGVIPAGWEVKGPFGMGIVFERSDSDAQIAFTILQTEGLVSAKDIIQLVIARNTGKPHVQMTEVTASPDGQEASLRIEDRRVGVKRGKAVARCFPTKTIYCVLTSGLWPDDIDAQSLQDFDTFLQWVRLE